VSGIAAGLFVGWALVAFAGGYISGLELPGAAALAGTAALVLAATVLAALAPAIRASRTDPVQALRAE
jgi:ABC-type antimicrobial peptide transport system permease subunit